ncbi:MAG: 4Fe-4S binding protein [Bacilli bacterium]|nr:4Fe-4S binding protein [Bacilli bacterium]
MNKVKAFVDKIKPSRRKVIQLYAAILTNAHLKGFVNGKIFQGESKAICVPGMNCYSCPGAVGACPLGSLQNSLASTNKSTLFFVLGIILLYATIFGRTICGYLCPAGLLQELLYKIKTPKLKKNKFTRILSYLKYVLLFILVIGIPLSFALNTTSLPVPAFCKYICPVGTFEGAVGLLINPNNNDYLKMLGPLFTWKFVLLIIFIVASVFIFRFFCRFFCPLGAIYGLFNKFALLGITVDEDKCTSCHTCVNTCKMDVKKVGDHECIMCGECKKVCLSHAIKYRIEEIKQLIHQEKEPSLEEKENCDTINPQSNKHSLNRQKAAKIVVTSVASVVLISSLIYFNSGNAKIYEGNAVGDKIISKPLQYINNETGNFLASDYEGKILVINFWGTWCGPCIMEMPNFINVTKEYSFYMETVAIHSKGEDINVVNNFIKSAWNTSDIHFAMDDEENAYYETLGGTGTYPMTLIVDQEGIINKKYVGSLSEENLRNDIINLINN